MKLRLEIVYPLFERCRTYGETDGSSWWVSLTKWGSNSDSVSIIVLPSDHASWSLNDVGKFYFTFAPGRLAVVLPLSRNGEARPDCPAILVDAIWLVNVVVSNIEFSPHYVVSESWLTSEQRIRFEKWQGMYRLSEEQAVELCVDFAKKICNQMHTRATERVQHEITT